MADDIGKTLVQRARDWGATNLRIEQGGKHPRLVGDYKGVAFIFVFPGSTGDRRAALNCLSDLRRIVGIEREVTAASFPQKRKRHRTKSTPNGEFKRLFPVRFRHLADEATFKRWDWVDFKYQQPRSDRRSESCRVWEDSIVVDGEMPPKDRAPFLNRLVSASFREAEAAGRSLALIRPKNTRFYYKPKKPEELEQERRIYADAARQESFLDERLKALEPSPYDFRFKFEDAAGQHDCANGDWEAHAMFFNGRRREGSDQATLDWMSAKFNDEYPRKGMLFCLGNMAKRPQTWQLLGVLRVDDTAQMALF